MISFYNLRLLLTAIKLDHLLPFVPRHFVAHIAEEGRVIPGFIRYRLVLISHC